MLIAALIAFALFFCAVAQAETLTGIARVIDADTLHFPELGEHVRLLGIDAPELKQSCRAADNTRYRCGQDAADTLKKRMGSGRVRCEANERGRYGRLIAVCFDANGADLNSWLVEQGYALAYRRYSTRYVVQERAARNAKKGIWQGRFVKPWRWRRGERLSERR